ncbi:MAG: hypothetical protein ABI083_11565 [Lapillicoccus sp.]
MKKSLSVGLALTAAAALTGGVLASTASADGSAAKNVPGKASFVAATPAAVGPARVFAVVNADSTLLRGKAVASTSHLSTGVYDVRFTKNISACSWVGTVGFGSFSGSTGPAMITITGRAGTNNGLFVTTFDSTGAPADLPFNADVICS